MTNVAIEVKPQLFVAADLTDGEIQHLAENEVAVYEVESVETPKSLEEEEVPVDVPAGETEEDKGMIFLIPGLPSAAVLIGAAAIGIVGGAASTVGSKLATDWWPKKKPAPKPAPAPAKTPTE
jgi:hypothetical protein